MYTEVELSEFIIRATLKIGDLVEEAIRIEEYGGDTKQVNEDIKNLRTVINTLNSEVLDWSEKDIIRRTEYLAQRYSLINKPSYTQDWLNNYKVIPVIRKSDGNYLSIPTRGEGYVVVENGNIKLVPDRQYTLSDLPNA